MLADALLFYNRGSLSGEKVEAEGGGGLSGREGGREEGIRLRNPGSLPGGKRASANAIIILKNIARAAAESAKNRLQGETFSADSSSDMGA